jgi:hypothetical protein
MVDVRVLSTVFFDNDNDSDSGNDSGNDNCNDWGSDSWSTLIFRSGRTMKGKGVVASFWLDPKNVGVGASFKLDLENQGVVASFWSERENLESCIFLQVRG